MAKLLCQNAWLDSPVSTDVRPAKENNQSHQEIMEEKASALNAGRDLFFASDALNKLEIYKILTFIGFAGRRLQLTLWRLWLG